MERSGVWAAFWHIWRIAGVIVAIIYGCNIHDLEEEPEKNRKREGIIDSSKDYQADKGEQLPLAQRRTP